MQDILNVNHSQLTELLTNVSTRRPVRIWGPRSIIKSSAAEHHLVGMPIQVAVASQVTSEDLISVPILDHAARTSRF